MTRLLPLLFLLAFTQLANAQNTPALEARIAAENPCTGLPEINRIDFVRIERVGIVAADDRMSASLSGALGCRTSGSALLPLSLSADIAVIASVELATCQMLSADVRLSNIAGSAGFLLDAFRPQAEAALGAQISDLLQDTCRSLTQF